MDSMTIEEESHPFEGHDSARAATLAVVTLVVTLVVVKVPNNPNRNAARANTTMAPTKVHTTPKISICSAVFEFLSLRMKYARSPPIHARKKGRSHHHVLVCSMGLMTGACLSGCPQLGQEMASGDTSLPQ